MISSVVIFFAVGSVVEIAPYFVAICTIFVLHLCSSVAYVFLLRICLQMNLIVNTYYRAEDNAIE